MPATVITRADLVDSVAAALQYISFMLTTAGVLSLVFLRENNGSSTTEARSLLSGSM